MCVTKLCLGQDVHERPRRVRPYEISVPYFRDRVKSP